MTKRAGIYVRVSDPSRQDAEDKVSIAMQLADCEAYCQERGYITVARYIENKRYKSKRRMVEPSGTRSDRPQYQAMLKAAGQGEFDVIVAWKEDRLCRGIYAAMPLGRVLEDTPVTIELVKETFDASMFFIKAAIGKVEIDNFRQRVHMGVQGQLGKGKAWDMHRRYGYALTEDRQLVHDSERAPWVAQIYVWYLKNVGVREIRRRLIDNAPTPNRKSGRQKQKVPWPLSTIHSILTAPQYYQGYIEARRDGKVYQIPCPPIVSREDFDAVQVLRKKKQSHAGLLVKNDYLCLGLVTCADERTWGARTMRWRSKGVLRKTPLGRYYCSGKDTHRKVYDHPDCPKTVGSKKLDTWVWQEVMTLLENPALVRVALDAEIEELRQAEREVEHELERIHKDLDALAMERQWVITQARKGRITEGDMDLQLGALTLQEKALLREQAEKSSLAAYRQQAEDLAEFAETYLNDVRVGLEWLNQNADAEDTETRKRVFERKRYVVEALVDRVVMHKDWPPELVFSFDVGRMVSGVSSESQSIGNAQYRLTFSWPIDSDSAPSLAEAQADGAC